MKSKPNTYNRYLFWLITGVLLSAYVQYVFAQTGRSDCPGLDDKPKAEQQSVCWFDRAERGEAECSASQNSDNPCMLQAASWCADAVFNQAQTANACFFSYLRTGQFEEALAVQRYLQEPSEQVAKCLRALEKISVKIASTPTGAEILIDGRSHGVAPVEVDLVGQWWKREMAARFQTGQVVSEKRVSARELRAVFDPGACVIGQLTIQRTQLERLEASLTPAQISNSELPSEKASAISIPGVVMSAFGGAGLITGSVLLVIAESNASEVRNPDGRTPMTEEVKDKYYSVKPMRIGGGVALGVGAALAAAGVALLIRGASKDTNANQPGATLLFSGQGLQWTSMF